MLNVFVTGLHVVGSLPMWFAVFVPLNFMVLAYHGEASYNVVVSFHERPAWPWLSVPPRTTLYQAMIWDVGSGFES